ncbi:methionine ABC transporter ATP-binding protein [Thalassorhabdus alkalitolerans]|uniref:methionine ABC transporter ATP-binding protein n=1 Tax=Thalassorhabdus alkalitolerans TaxID=2282697 RepID=UPI0036DC54F0
MISLNEVVKNFPGRDKRGKSVSALRDVTLNVEKGEIFGVTGARGSGKSTLLRSVNVLDRPTKGRVVVQDNNMVKLSAESLRKARQNIGMVTREAHLLECSSVYENIALPLKLTGVSSSEIKRRTETYLAFTGLETKQSAYPQELTELEKQKTALTRTLALEPEILLCDEVTDLLDREGAASLISLLLNVNKEFHTTMLVSTRNIETICKLCDRAAVMASGKIVEQAPVIDLLSNPQSEEAKALISRLFPVWAPEEMKPVVTQAGQAVTLTYAGRATIKPAYALAAKKYNVFMNILTATVLQLKNESFSRMVVHIQGSDKDISSSLEFLKGEGIGIERLDPDDF